ncbi:MAG: thioredoxin family protein [Desulfobulbaceae bacterium]|nr:thioredoxin family protein [Desulfobulbaceae bacterium]
MVKKLRLRICLTLLICLFLSIPVLRIAGASEFNNLPVKGMVTMIDLGAKKCIPCKMMAPIMAKMEKVYKEKAAIVFIDVWEHREQASRFKIRAIPTQIFFDKNSKEVYRHVGFMSEKEIVRQLNKMGVD